jgi:Reverse transcriptase (RNA-dependent DNA polymerase)
LKNAGTWELVDPPSGANIVGSKWVFRAKKDAAGNIARYKARLVAQGFSQVPGVDYFDTYAPVAKLASTRTVLALAARLDMEIHQIDIKGAYLNGELTPNEIIYMRQPPGYASTESPNKVALLKKTLYGLKQSGRRWYQRLVKILVSELGFTQCEVDQAVFFKTGKSSKAIIVVHVDDCSIAATSLAIMGELKTRIGKFVEVTDLGELHWLLGIEITRDRERRTISMSQRSYIDSILRRYGFEDLKPISTPMDPHIRLSSAQSPTTGLEFAAMKNIPYREAVGSLMYASLGTRPDISFAVTTLSRFSVNPGSAHWEAVKRVFRYLKGTQNLWLTFGGEEKTLIGYTDADGSMAEDRRAISGYAFLIDGGAVSWSAKKQEYVAATYATKEALWLRTLINQLFSPLPDATTLLSDNQSAIALAKDHQYHARTKHIDVRFHFIRWVIEEGALRLIFCPTDDMVADCLTKALPSHKVKHFASELGLRVA